jgi:WD40 repeat protein
MHADVHAVAIGPLRTLFMSTADGALLSMPLAPPGTAHGTGTAVMHVASTPRAHSSAVDALALSRSGKVIVSGGNDRLLKLWSEADVRSGACTPNNSRARPLDGHACQPYAGHSDHVTRLIFSSDGATLVSVGGGDAVYIWDFKGARAVRIDPTRAGVAAAAKMPLQLHVD